MKKVFFVFAVIALAILQSCQDKVASVSGGNPDSTANANNNVTYPYPVVTYPYPVVFSKFQIGDANQAKMLLEIWKDWDNGNLMNHKDYFADSLAMFIADGPPMMGKRDSVLASAQNYRNTYTTVQSSIDAIVPLHSVDSSQNFVAVWGLERHTDKNGKMDSVYLQEVWRLNKDNKFDLMYQYNSIPGAMPPPPPAAAKK
jgi:hypothetical protein